MPYSVTTAAPPRPRLCCSATFAPGTCLPPARPRSCQQSSAHCARPERWSTDRVAAPPPSSRRGAAPEGSADRPGAAPAGLRGKVVFMGFTRTHTHEQCSRVGSTVTLRLCTSHFATRPPSLTGEYLLGCQCAVLKIIIKHNSALTCESPRHKRITTIPVSRQTHLLPHPYSNALTSTPSTSEARIKLASPSWHASLSRSLNSRAKSNRKL